MGDTYNTVCTSTTFPTAPPTSIERPPEVEITGGPGLARTGANNILPLIQAAIVLLGGGTLLVLVARRRRVERRATG